MNKQEILRKKLFDWRSNFDIPWILFKEDKIPSEERKFRTGWGCISKREIEEIAKLKPRTLSELEDIEGIGPIKSEKYGGDILKIVNNSMKTKFPKLTEKDIKELRYLLADWEDKNISDYEYCNKAGDILWLGKWTCKGRKRIDLEDPQGTKKEMDEEEQRVELMINKIMENTEEGLSKEDLEIFYKLVGDEDAHRVLRNIAYRGVVLGK